MQFTYTSADMLQAAVCQFVIEVLYDWFDWGESAWKIYETIDYSMLAMLLA